MRCARLGHSITSGAFGVVTSMKRNNQSVKREHYGGNLLPSPHTAPRAHRFPRNHPGQCCRWMDGSGEWLQRDVAGSGAWERCLGAQALDVFRSSSKWHCSLPTCPAGKASMQLTQSVDLNKARAEERGSAIRRGTSVLWAAVGVASLSEAHHAHPCPGPLREHML